MQKVESRLRWLYRGGCVFPNRCFSQTKSIVDSSPFLHCTGSISMDWWRCSQCINCKGVAVVTNKSLSIVGVQNQVLDSPVVTSKSLGNNRYYRHLQNACHIYAVVTGFIGPDGCLLPMSAVCSSQPCPCCCWSWWITRRQLTVDLEGFIHQREMGDMSIS
jgi:hypothetical protein